VDKNQTIIANYKGGSVSLNQAQIEIEKLAVQNPSIKGVKFNNLTSDQQELIIKEVVLKEKIYKEAKKQGLNKDEDYQQALKIFETELLKQKLFAKLIEDAKKEGNIKAQYDKLVKNLENKQDFKIRYIALKNEDEANKIYQKLTKKPNLFNYYAKNKSIDKEAAKKSGDLGFVLETLLPAQIQEKANVLADNEISSPIELGQDKWAIIKVEDRRKAQIVPFEKAKDALAQSLAQKAIGDFVTKSLEEADISIVVK
jgi:parvulin-like peptidyl-prolyl isomerase